MMPMLGGVLVSTLIAVAGFPAPADGSGVEEESAGWRTAPTGGAADPFRGPHEVVGDPYVQVPREQQRVTPAVRHRRGQYVSIQVNVDADGHNIVGDAANEPSIAVDPHDPDRMVIGWRQFNTVASNFRQAGWAYTSDGGATWTFPGVIDPGVFRSDPVVDVNADGIFFYNSLTVAGSLYLCHVFRSEDGGASWGTTAYAYGGDKQWQVIDTTDGVGRNNIYANWTRAYSICSGSFTRSYDGGVSFVDCTNVPGSPSWGTLAVGPTGDLYVSGNGFVVTKSTTMKYAGQPAQWDFSRTVNLDGSMVMSAGPNPGGLLGQNWIAVDHSDGPTHGYVYMVCSVERDSNPDPLDVMFARSTDGGWTWSAPVRINDDPGTSAWQWFATMSVAPNGRIDVVWADTRNDPGGYLSELYYSYSADGGVHWSPNTPLTPPFDPHVGWPHQNKLGDYYDMWSDDVGVSLAYAATFNNEQDVYFLRISVDCNDNGTYDLLDISAGTSFDCNENWVPDECDIADGSSWDDDLNGVPDECEVTRYYVKADATGTGHGTSWTDAYTSLKPALDSAAQPCSPVTEVWVAEGTYTPGVTRAATFTLGSGVAVYGGFTGVETDVSQRDPVRHVTILSGDLNGDDGPGFTNISDNSHHVVTASGTDATALLDGFVIRGGNPTGATTINGGGILNVGGHAIFRNCRILNNSGNQGSGMYNTTSAGPTLINCAFSGNSAAVGTLAAVSSSTLTIIHGTLAGNTALVGAGLFLAGSTSVATATSCVLWGNTDNSGSGQSSQVYVNSGTVALNYSCVQGWTGSLGGTGNTGADPLLIDIDGADNLPGTLDDNLRLSAGSSGINTGDPGFVPAPEDRDLDGHARLLCSRVDMGAYEFGIGDYDCDQDVDLADVAALQNCFTGTAGGAYSAGCEAVDFDLDGRVDAQDFAGFQALLAGP